MRLFKKFFSLRRSKKRSGADHHPESHPPVCVQEHLQVDDTEAALSRLLRSSSGRYVAEPQTGLDSLPPLPHPIDSVIPLPKSSTTTIASVSARSTYSVTIRSRTVHSRTEFPNAYPPMDAIFTPKRSLTESPRRRSRSVPITPRDRSPLQLLRQDPSVASLLNHYDDEGHLNSALFSNSPSPRKGGGVQRRHTGSTLRQLLGHPSTPDLRNASTEGDISWAEKFLGEIDCNSSQSSIGPQTPADTHFTNSHSIDNKPALPTECDTTADNQRTFSSLEVELSASIEVVHPPPLDSPHSKSTTPQRASQIFDFLGDKKRANDGPTSRLPQLKATSPYYRRFSAESSLSDTNPSHIPLPRRNSTCISQLISPTSPGHFSIVPDAGGSSPPSPTAGVFLPSQPEDRESALSLAISQQSGQSSRSPRGPRSSSRIPSRQSTGPMLVPCHVGQPGSVTEQMQPALSEKSNSDDRYIGITAARLRETHSQIPKLRSSSGSSNYSAESRHEPATHSPRQHPACLQPGVRIKPRSAETEHPTVVLHDKENDALSRLPQPVTPARPFGLHSLHLREQPSPTSSSELSPVAKQMMANLREQRMQARLRERQAGRLGSNQSRIRH